MESNQEKMYILLSIVCRWGRVTLPPLTSFLPLEFILILPCFLRTFAAAYIKFSKDSFPLFYLYFPFFFPFTSSFLLFFPFFPFFSFSLYSLKIRPRFLNFEEKKVQVVKTTKIFVMSKGESEPNN